MAQMPANFQCIFERFEKIGSPSKILLEKQKVLTLYKKRLVDVPPGVLSGWSSSALSPEKKLK